MVCRYCDGARIVWRKGVRGPYTLCQDCKRRNCERGTSALPHGNHECIRAQLQLKML